MGKLPWMKFFYADWLRDTRALSVAAKGAWIDTICYAWGSPRRGEIVGTEDSFARMWGCSTREAHTIIIELTTHAICECVTDDHGNVTLMSRRIVREEKQREQARKRKERERSRQCHADGIDACHGSVTAQKSEVRSQKSEPEASAPASEHGCSETCQSQIANQNSQISRAPSDLALWRSHMLKRRGTIKSYENGFNKSLMLARAEVLRKLAAKKTLKSLADLPDPSNPSTKAAAADFLFDLSSFERTLLANLRKVGASALQDAGLQLLAEIGKADDPWAMTPTEVLDFLKSRENKIVGAAQETFDSLKSSLEEGLESGETIDELSDRVRAKFNEMSDGRARRIAMTETAAAYGVGRDVAMKDAGVQFKRWLTSGNDNVRPAHFQANNQTVPINEPYIVGGEKLQHPGDPDGSPGNVINCHCVSIAVAPPSDKSHPSDSSDTPPTP